MTTLRRPAVRRRGHRRGPIRIVLFTATFLIAVQAQGCGPVHHMLMGGNGAERPPAEAFGLGPRVSEGGLYQVTLEPHAPLGARELLTVPAAVRDRSGLPVEDAQVSVDGGMPEHDHGLPTRPRAGPNGAPGVYDIVGLRFNMGGWWELRLTITGSEGTDTVTFHLDI